MPDKEKTLNDLQRLINSKNFKSKEELDAFLQDMITNNELDMEELELSEAEKAEDLVFEAYDALFDDKAQEYINEALNLDPMCIPAYEYMAGKYENIWLAMTFYQKAIEVGQVLFNQEYVHENRGHFWMIHETRPFMRCMQAYAECQMSLDFRSAAIDIFEEMIQLNPNDNQGVRDPLMTLLLMENQYIKYQKYRKMYENDLSAFHAWNYALFLFKTKGDSQQTKEALHLAIEHNRYVPKRLLSARPPKTAPESYKLKSAAEADYYAFTAYNAWKQTQGVFSWLEKNTK
ncbi:MAG: hypothetical protein WBG46_13995 [Nonlabens sp.]